MPLVLHFRLQLNLRIHELKSVVFVTQCCTYTHTPSVHAVGSMLVNEIHTECLSLIYTF